SASPVVAVLLPLLFALLGGGAGLYLATMDLSKPYGAEQASTLRNCHDNVDGRSHTQYLVRRAGENRGESSLPSTRGDDPPYTGAPNRSWHGPDSSRSSSCCCENGFNS